MPCTAHIYAMNQIAAMTDASLESNYTYRQTCVCGVCVCECALQFKAIFRFGIRSIVLRLSGCAESIVSAKSIHINSTNSGILCTNIYEYLGHANIGHVPRPQQTKIQKFSTFCIDESKKVHELVFAAFQNSSIAIKFHRFSIHSLSLSRSLPFLLFVSLCKSKHIALAVSAGCDLRCDGPV